MSRKWISIFVCLLAAAGLAVLFIVASAQAPLQETQSQPGSGQTPPPLRERQSGPNAPTISFIDSPSASCYHPIQAPSDACYIDWSSIQVSASASNYIISMTVQIDGRFRAYYAGFFQTSIYIPADMHSPGLKVSCGAPGSNPNLALGKTYSYTIRARETGGLAAANYGAVTCPAGPRKIFLPRVNR